MRHLAIVTSRITLLAFLVLAAATCSSDTSTTPSGSHPGEVSVSPTFDPNPALAALPVTQEVLTVVRAPAETLESLTTPRTLTDGPLTITVPVDLASVSESVVVTLELRNEATPLLRGVDTLEVTSGATGVELPIAVRYAGPGANIAHLTVTTPDTFLVADDSLSYQVTATDAADQPVPASFVHWSTNTVNVAIRQDGVIVGPNLRQAIQIRAQVPNGTQDSAGLAILPRPSQLVAIQGDGAVGTVGDTLPTPLVVEVRGADALPIRSVRVVFAVANGGGSVVLDTVRTDSTGRASTRAVLGTVAGPQTFTAKVGAILRAFNVTASGGTPSGIATVSGNGQVDTALQTLPQPLTVRVTDGFGNPAPGARVAWTRISGTGNVSSDTTLTDANGKSAVQFTLSAPGLDSIRATLVGTGATIDFAATSVPGAPATIQIVAGDTQQATVGTAVAIAPKVKVVDANGFAVPGATVTFSASQGGGSVTGATPVTDDSGFATLGSWTLGATPGANQLHAQAGAGVDAFFGAFALPLNPSVQLSLVGTTVVPVGGTATLRALLTTPAGAGGITVNLSTSAAVVILPNAPFVTVPAGDSIALFTLFGSGSVGSADLIGVASGYAPDTLTVNALDNVIALDDSAVVPLGQTAPLTVRLSHPAPAGGVTIDLASLDPAKVTLLAPIVNIAAGDSTATATVSGVGIGAAGIVASNPGYLPDTAHGRTSAAFNITLAADTLFSAKGGPLTIELRAGGVLTAAPAGGIGFDLVSRDPACVAGRTTTITAGQKTVVDSAVYGGAAPLPCETYLVATAPGVDPDSVKVRMTQPHLAFTVPVTGPHRFTSAGDGLQDSTQVDLGLGLGGQNHPPVTVTLRVLEHGIGVLQPDAFTPGTDTIQLSVPNGVAKPQFYFAGIEGIVRDTVQVEASSPGFAPDTLFLIVRTHEMFFSPNVTSQMTPASAIQPVRLTLAVSDLVFRKSQAVRAGGPAASVWVRSSNPSKVRIVNSGGFGDSLLVTWAAGQGQTPATLAAGGIGVEAIDTGTATVAALSPLFENFSGQITVQAAAFNAGHLTPGVGSGLQRIAHPSFTLNGVAHGATTVTIKTSDPTLLLVSPNDSTTGTDSIDVVMPDGSNGFNFYLQAIEGQVGQSIVTVSAPGFVTKTDTVDVVAPVVAFCLCQSLPPSTIAANAPSVGISASVGIPDAGNTTIMEQQTVRPGGTGPVTVTFTNSATGVGQLVRDFNVFGDILTALIPPRVVGTFNTQLEFDPLTPGLTTLSVSAPGFGTVTRSSVTINVTP